MDSNDGGIEGFVGCRYPIYRRTAWKGYLKPINIFQVAFLPYKRQTK